MTKLIKRVIKKAVILILYELQLLNCNCKDCVLGGKCRSDKSCAGNISDYLA